MVTRTGQVKDEYDRLVPGATVYVYNNATGVDALSAPLTTDEFGAYSYDLPDEYYREDTWYGGKLRFREIVAVGNPGADLNLRSDLSQPTGAGLLGWVASGAGAIMRPIRDKLRDAVSVKDFGAVGDGVTDDRAAIAAAVAGARGRRILFPKGNYLINTDGGTITLEEVGLVGEDVLDGAPTSIDEGANLLITGTTNSPFKIRRGTYVDALGIYYPNQTDSATPTVYPTTFVFDFTNGAVQFVYFTRNVIYNAYRFMDIDNGSTGAVGHVEIDGNYICALNRGIYIRYNAEHFRVENNNFTFGFWTAATEAGSRAYMRANAIALQADQSDGIEFVDNLVYGYLTGLLLAAQGLCQFQKISENKFDDVRYPIKATGTGNFNGQISLNTFNAINSQSTALEGRSFSVDTSGSGVEAITIFGNNFGRASKEHIYTSGDVPTRRLNLGVNDYLSWAAFSAATTYAAINANGAQTNVTVVGGSFSGSGNPTHSKGIIGTFNKLQVTGADFDQCLAAIDVSVTYATLTGNRATQTGGSTSDLVVSTDFVANANRWDKPAATTAAVAAGTYTTGVRDQVIIFSVACVLTLPAAASWSGREIQLVTTGANAITSASSNVVGLTGGAAGTAILPATAGKWARLRSNGTAWQIVAAN